VKIKDTEIKIIQGDIAGLKVDHIVNDITVGTDLKANEEKIRNSCRNSLRLAGELKIKSVAFPALGCGTGAFPYLASAKIMAQEVYCYLREEATSLREIIFCLFDNEAFDCFNKGVLDYLEYITVKLQNGPFTVVDAIIEIGGKIVLIKRANPPFGWALPGGFVDYGESLEKAVIREAKEETDLDIEDIQQFHTYSDPDRDPRFHTIGTVFIAKAKGRPQAGDDASGIKLIGLEEVEKTEVTFDHKRILRDYIKYKKTKRGHPF